MLTLSGVLSLVKSATELKSTSVMSLHEPALSQS